MARTTGPADANTDAGAPRRALTPAAERALAEAAARRAASHPAEAPKEIDGRDGPEPVRYGDWEVKGIASDF
ncbi:DUF1674 domain-containing protein [Ancylobacter mangrovi]|uniref:DUF1674 domain-containing protein n=1 Tax=Ancylobacter mangrovi TaxID=2972472 RepID=UPI002163AB8B|nr:DUF1674 domain-containing protein [Ancylobacter mangrovi]MCS0502543.1 DUF1674 domain-containing protein [Ancylobacter mangrovi]